MSDTSTYQPWAAPSYAHLSRMWALSRQGGFFSPNRTPLFVGISAVPIDDKTTALAIAIRDANCLVDFSFQHVPTLQPNNYDCLTSTIIDDLSNYQKWKFAKFIAAGIPPKLKSMSPRLCSRLWMENDVVPIVIDSRSGLDTLLYKCLDEHADSMARKCMMHFGPSAAPILRINSQGIVTDDPGICAELTTADWYQDACGQLTWQATMSYAKKIEENSVMPVFFSSTPRGGNIAPMRHALLRFSRQTGVLLNWVVPKPRPGILRPAKKIHNILQGLSEPGQFVSKEEKELITNWITETADRYWFSGTGPLCPPEEGGADVIIIDDPQMSALIPLIKENMPSLPVIYRSHIPIRSDLVAEKGSPQADIWEYLWSNIKHADMFISHPIPEFVPKNVPKEKVAYLPATADWLDGLNKRTLVPGHNGYYGHIYNQACHANGMTELNYPKRKYIAQVGPFDPGNGIADVINAYAEFRRLCDVDGITDVPQLVVCGNRSADDCCSIDALPRSMVYDQTLDQIDGAYPQLAADISVMRLDPNDQLLNMIVSCAHVVLQLPTREAFGIKVSEALHAGRPVIVTNVGGLPLQVKPNVNAFVVEPGDTKAVAQHLVTLFTHDELYKKMSDEASRGLSDEVSIVGNALCWYYLTWKCAVAGEKVVGDGRWVNGMAREEAGCPYQDGENRLPRDYTECYQGTKRKRE